VNIEAQAVAETLFRSINRLRFLAAPVKSPHAFNHRHFGPDCRTASYRYSSAQIVPGARVGFVGRNGVGKSTLFHAIRGELPTESGSITIPPRWRVGSLAQEAPTVRKA